MIFDFVCFADPRKSIDFVLYNSYLNFVYIIKSNIAKERERERISTSKKIEKKREAHWRAWLSANKISQVSFTYRQLLLLLWDVFRIKEEGEILEID